MHILFVDDNPSHKVYGLLPFLEEECHTFTIRKSTVSALRYLYAHNAEIDVAIIDLGLPHFDDGSDYNRLAGIDIIEEIVRKEWFGIRVIINSTTAIPNEEDFLKRWKNAGANVTHFPSIAPDWFKWYLREI